MNKIEKSEKYLNINEEEEINCLSDILTGLKQKVKIEKESLAYAYEIKEIKEIKENNYNKGLKKEEMKK